MCLLFALTTAVSVAACPIDAGISKFITCESDIDSHDPHQALEDCTSAGAAFRACRADPQFASESAKVQDEIQFYIAYSLFGQAGAEMKLATNDDQVHRAKRDFYTSKVGFQKVIARGNVSDKMLNQAKMMVGTMEQNGY